MAEHLAGVVELVEHREESFVGSHYSATRRFRPATRFSFGGQALQLRDRLRGRRHRCDLVGEAVRRLPAAVLAEQGSHPPPRPPRG